MVHLPFSEERVQMSRVSIPKDLYTVFPDLLKSKCGYFLTTSLTGGSMEQKVMLMIYRNFVY